RPVADHPSDDRGDGQDDHDRDRSGQVEAGSGDRRHESPGDERPLDSDVEHSGSARGEGGGGGEDGWRGRDEGRRDPPDPAEGLPGEEPEELEWGLAGPGDDGRADEEGSDQRRGSGDPQLPPTS